MDPESSDIRRDIPTSLYSSIRGILSELNEPVMFQRSSTFLYSRKSNEINMAQYCALLPLRDVLRHHKRLEDSISEHERVELCCLQ